MNKISAQIVPSLPSTKLRFSTVNAVSAPAQVHVVCCTTVSIIYRPILYTIPICTSFFLSFVSQVLNYLRLQRLKITA